MKVVIDLGCYPHDDRNSCRELIEKYRPALLLGFDPLVVPGVGAPIDGVPCVYSNAAAWVHNGTIGFTEDGLSSRVGEGDRDVQCFDLVSLLKIFPEAILKMDVEGAEYDLLEHLSFQRVWPSLILVEWHEEYDPFNTRHQLLAALRCPVEEWWM